ncbi:MAG: hypothetical protein WC868_01885 [Bacteroidales bacterium]
MEQACLTASRRQGYKDLKVYQLAYKLAQVVCRMQQQEAGSSFVTAKCLLPLPPMFLEVWQIIRSRVLGITEKLTASCRCLLHTIYK